MRFLSPPEKSASIEAQIGTFEKGIIFKIDPATLLGWKIYFFGTYEAEVRNIINKALSKGFVAFDVGANVGWHTLLMAKGVGKEGHVLAFEPNPGVYDCLKENIAFNNLSQVIVSDLALSDNDGELYFNAPPSSSIGAGAGHIINNVDSSNVEQKIKVKTKKLDTIFSTMNLSRLDLIKIDVEGWEWNVLEGAKETLKRYRPYIIFEYDAKYIIRSGGISGNLDKLFSDLSYSIYRIYRNKLLKVENCWPVCANIFALPNEKTKDFKLNKRFR